MNYDRDAPLRLKVAARAAFPDGTMTASGLRREAERGRLVIERIAGKDFTTLAHIQRMRELCRVEARDRACTSNQHDATHADAPLSNPSGSSATATSSKAQDLALATVERLTKGSPDTSSAKKVKRERRRSPKNVIPLRSKSPT
jgi:hypothetical protein